MQEIKETTIYRLLLRERILSTAMEAFLESGIRAVKMDDIARSLGISKRTLYEIYSDKEEVLFQGVKKFNSREQEYLNEYAKKNHVIDVIMEAYRRKVEYHSQINPLFYDDLLKYPKIETLIKEEHDRSHHDFVCFLNRGVEEGMFRQDFDYEIISRLFDALGHYCIQNKLLHVYSMRELFVNTYVVMLRGCCTKKGLEALEQAIAKIR